MTETPSRAAGDKLDRAQGTGFSSGASPPEVEKRARTTGSSSSHDENDERLLMEDLERGRRDRLRAGAKRDLEKVQKWFDFMEQRADSNLAPLLGEGFLKQRFSSVERDARVALLNLAEGHRDMLVTLMHSIEELVLERDAAPNTHQPDAAAVGSAGASSAGASSAGASSAGASSAPRADFATHGPPASVFLNGVRFECAAEVPGDPMKDLAEETKDALEKGLGVGKGSSSKAEIVAAAITRRGDRRRLDAPVSSDDLRALETKLSAFIERYSKDKVYPVSKLKEALANGDRELPERVRILLLSGPYKQLLLKVAKGILAEGRSVRENAKTFLHEDFADSYESLSKRAEPDKKTDFEYVEHFKADLENDATTRERSIEASEEIRKRSKVRAPRVIEKHDEVKARKDAFERARRDGVSCRRHILAALRDATAETEALQMWVLCLLTPRLTHKCVDGELSLTLPPMILGRDGKSGWGRAFRDSVASGGKTGRRGDLLPGSAYLCKTGPGHGIPRNASSMTGGQGSSGGRGSARGSPSVHAEMRPPIDRLPKPELPPPSEEVAGILTHFLCNEDTSLAFDFEFAGHSRGTTNIPPSDVSIGMLRGLPPLSAANGAARLSGPDGVCGVRGDDDEALLKVAENCPFKINVDFFRNNKTKTLLGDLLACYLTLHALVFADYPTLRRDLTRRVFPIFTEVSLAPFRLRAMRGWAYVTDDDEKKAFIEESAANTQASSMAKFLRRFMEALAPFGETKQAKAALAKIMGDKVVAIRVKRSIKEYQPPLDLPDPLKSFDEAGLDLAALVVEGVEAFAGLSPGQPVARGDLATRAKRLNDHLEQRFSWRTQSGFESVDVSMMNLLRVSQKKTLTEPHRRGFASQLDLFVQIKRRDGDNWLCGGMYIARDLSRFADGAVEHAWALNPERLDDAVPSLDGEPKTTSFVAAPGEAIKHRTKKDPTDSDVVVVRVAYANRLSLEMLAELRKNKVVGVDAFDLRRLVRMLPCLRLAAEGPLATAIDVREGRPGFAVLAVVLLFAEAATLDLNILRHLGMLAAAKREDRSFNDETKKRYLDRIARDGARTVKQYEEIVLPAFSSVVATSGATSGSTSGTPTPGSTDATPQGPVESRTDFRVAYRLSSSGQTFHAQRMAVELAELDRVESLELQPFGARESLDKLEEDDKKKALAACAWASTSRLANRGVLENARENKRYLCSIDIAVAVAEKKIDERWVRADQLRGNANSASLNLQDEHVYKFMFALRAVGHFYDRVLKNVLVSRAHGIADEDEENVDFD